MANGQNDPDEHCLLARLFVEQVGSSVRISEQTKAVPEHPEAYSRFDRGI
jgi:hypothetical protein